LRDGMHQTAIHDGISPYLPNGLDAAPAVATESEGAYVQVPRPIEGEVVRAAPVSFEDHLSQATLFFRSLTTVEQSHMVEAFTFELGKVFEQEIKERELAVLADVDDDLCSQVAAGLGLPAPKGSPARNVIISPALSQIVDKPGPIDGRKVGVIADTGSDSVGIAKLRRALEKCGAEVLVIAPSGGMLSDGAEEIVVDRTLLTTRSVEFDALVVAAETEPTTDIKLVILLQEAYRHCKTLGAWGNGSALLESAGIPLSGDGMVTGNAVGKAFTDELVASIGLHRAWARAEAVMASIVPPA
jgi:catalase